MRARIDAACRSRDRGQARATTGNRLEGIRGKTGKRRGMRGENWEMKGNKRGKLGKERELERKTGKKKGNKRENKS